MTPEESPSELETPSPPLPLLFTYVDSEATEARPLKDDPPAEAPKQPSCGPLEGGAHWSDLHGNGITHGMEAVLVGGISDCDALALRRGVSVLSCQHQDVACTCTVQFQRSGLIVKLTIVLMHAGNISKSVVLYM